MSAFDLAADHDSLSLADQARANPLDLSQPAGFFTGMGTGAVTGVGRLLADTQRTTGLALGAVAGSFDMLTGDALKAQEKVFEHIVTPADKLSRHLAPKPEEIGMAGQLLHGLIKIGGEAVAFGAPGVLALETVGGTLDALDKGVDLQTAAKVGGVQGVATTAGVIAPMTLGASGLGMNLLYGAGINLAQGVFQRGATSQIYENAGRHDLAMQFKALDGEAMAVDAILGAAFAGGGRALQLRGEKAKADAVAEYRAKIADLLKPEQIDAALVKNEQLKMERSGFGLPADLPSRDAHVANMNGAIDDLIEGRPVTMRQEVGDMLPDEAAAKVQADVAEVLRAEVDPVAVKLEIDEATGLPLNEDGTVTLYHHTSAKNADQIRKTGRLKAAGEPDVYVTTRRETDTGYGDTAVPIRVKPDTLLIDDEFPDGRKDFRLNVGKPGGSIKVAIHDETVAPKVGADTTAARPDFDQFARQYVESQPVDKFDHAQRIADAEAEIRKDYMLGNKDGSQFFEQLNEEDAARFFDEDGDLTDAGNARYVELQDQAVAKEARDQVGKPQQKQIDFSDPEHAAQVLRDYLDAAGLDPNVVGGSGKSRSKYFEIENGKRMIRVSDHELPDHYVNDSDIEVLLPQDSGAALAEIRALAERLVAEKGMAVVKDSLTPEPVAAPAARAVDQAGDIDIPASLLPDTVIPLDDADGTATVSEAQGIIADLETARAEQETGLRAAVACFLRAA